MTFNEAYKHWYQYHRCVFRSIHRLNSKANTLKTYLKTVNRFIEDFGCIDIHSVNQLQIQGFLEKITQNKKKTTRKTRYSTISSFFNFIKSNLDTEFNNLCDTPFFKNQFKKSTSQDWNVFDKETIDEIIFKTSSIRNRLILELMARGGMRIGEVLKLTPCCINGNKLTLVAPKSGKDKEYVFIPAKISTRLNRYVKENTIAKDDLIFPLSYEGARLIVNKAGLNLNIKINPHDLRRHAATYASRSGVPLEIISKVILRHSNLSTTQRYLGKISDNEAGKWIENLFG